MSTVSEGGYDDQPYYIVVGVSGEDLGTTKDAGAVVIGDLSEGPSPSLDFGAWQGAVCDVVHLG